MGIRSLPMSFQEFFDGDSSSSNQASQGTTGHLRVIWHGQCCDMAFLGQNYVTPTLAGDSLTKCLESPHNFTRRQKRNWRHQTWTST